MKKLIRNPWVLGIGTTVIGGVLLSFVTDWIKGINWLSTLKTATKCIINVAGIFLNYELKVWWVLVSIAVVGLILIIVKIFESKLKNDTPDFLNYTGDYVLGFMWEWDYTKTYDGRFTISNLRPVCSKCGMRLKQGYTGYGMEMKCLRCNASHSWEDHYRTDARMLIEDNIKKNYLQNH